MGSLRRRDLRPTHRIIHTLPENFKENLIPDNIYVGVFICGRRILKSQIFLTNTSDQAGRKPDLIPVSIERLWLSLVP